MKKQAKSGLFVVAVGLSLSSAMLLNAGHDTAGPASHHQQVLKAPQTPSPVAASPSDKPSKLPASFYLRLISRMADGGSIDANIFIPERPATIWDENSEWTPER